MPYIASLSLFSLAYNAARSTSFVPRLLSEAIVAMFTGSPSRPTLLRDPWHPVVMAGLPLLLLTNSPSTNSSIDGVSGG